ncbi:MAG: response regulator, partial [Bacteriovoracaceae bacterium]|nr:response regulator [Bacteriovoracaceae bacterium]
QEQEWRDSITFKAELGLMFKDTLSISPSGVRWKDISFTLEQVGITTKALSNPDDLFDILNQFQPELIVLDLYMPKYDGLEIAKIIRQKENYRHIPIVFLSSEYRVDKKILALESGGDEFLAKPIRTQHLLSAVMTRLKRARLLLKATQELTLAKDEAQKASLAKTEFLANMSHEIRTPLNAIIGAVQILSDMPISNEQEQLINVLDRTSHNLLELINNILDLSKIESGHLTLENIPMSLHNLVKQTSDILSLSAFEKNINLFFDIDTNIPPSLLGDPTRIKQVLLNLVGNAIKFTAQGEIIVQISLLKESATDIEVLFSISDTGIGISEDKLNLIFKPFQQGDSSITRKYSGTGLGLDICKKIINSMNGNLDVKSQLGKGSTFFFNINLKKSLQKTEEKALPAISSFHLLLKLHNAQEQQILEQILAYHAISYEILSPKTMNKNFENKKLILILDETFLTEKLVIEFIKRTPLDRLFIPAHTPSYNLSSDFSSAEFIIRPFIFHPSLAEQLRFLPLISTSTSEFKKADMLPDFSHKKILFADDSPDNHLIIKYFLQNTHCILDMVFNGEEVLKKVQQENFDLILMDVQMPYMDGLTATRLIRQREKEKNLARIPIIALSAFAMNHEIEQSLQAGCDLHLTKPLHKQTLLKNMAQILKTNKFIAFQEQIKLMASTYLKKRKEELIQAQEALNDKNYSFLIQIGHQIKGNAATYGFPLLGIVGSDLEKSAQKKEDSSLVLHLQKLQELLNEYDT